MPAPLLQVKDVTKRYESSGDTDGVNVLAGITFSLAAGEALAIVGPSGSGKSTLLQIIGTLDRASSGEVLLDGKNLITLDDLELAAVRNRQIGFIFQSHYLLPQCTVIENVLVPTLAESGRARPSGRAVNVVLGSGAPGATRPSETTNARAERLLKRVGLTGRLRHRPGQLSGGERQRVAVVRALINQPQLLLADEPTGALDHASATSLGQLLVELNQEEGVTLIVVTHAPDLAKRMERAVELRDGKLVQ